MSLRSTSTFVAGAVLDGLSSESLAKDALLGTVATPGYVETTGTSGDPSDDAIIAVAACPQGGQVLTEENAANVAAYARCWDPQGDVTDSIAPGYRSGRVQHQLSPAARRVIAKAAARR